jgi:hypothetical protein
MMCSSRLTLRRCVCSVWALRVGRGNCHFQPNFRFRCCSWLLPLSTIRRLVCGYAHARQRKTGPTGLSSLLETDRPDPVFSRLLQPGRHAGQARQDRLHRLSQGGIFGSLRGPLCLDSSRLGSHSCQFHFQLHDTFFCCYRSILTVSAIPDLSSYSSS